MAWQQVAAWIAEQANDWAKTVVPLIANRREAARMRSWQERMANTSYQRAVSDMLAAGLNPALMYGGAHQAPTPTPVYARMDQVRGESDIWGKIYSAKRLKKELEMLQYQVAEQKSRADMYKEMAKEIKTRRILEPEKVNADIGYHSALMQKLQEEMKMLERTNEMYDTLPALKWVEEVLDKLGGSGIINNLLRGLFGRRKK